MDKLVYREEAYQIIGICMEMHRILGKGHSEVVYKDALEYDPIAIGYKKIILSYFYNADFVVFDKIILEVKAIELLTDSHVKQTLNYLVTSEQKLGLLVNFGQDNLVHKRTIL